MVKKDQNSNDDTIETQARKADVIDRHVGKKLREHRRMLEMSQQDVSELLGISYQQIQKYESGANRISAGRLYTLAYIMQVPVHKFFEGLPPAGQLITNASADTHSASATDQYNANCAHTKNPEVTQALETLVQAIQRSSYP
jgi:transcriptional regulator with XRE-family HTH domain